MRPLEPLLREAGTRSWEQTPEHRRPPSAASVTNVRRWADALFTEPTPLAAFRLLDIPVLQRSLRQLPQRD